MHRSPYLAIAHNIDQFQPETAPKAADGTSFHDAFIRYLELVYSPEETDHSKSDPSKCIGCGLCTLVCPEEILKLHRHERSKPFNTAEELLMTVAVENRGG